MNRTSQFDWILFNSLFDGTLHQRVAATLGHFLWQGVVIAVVAAVMAGVLRQRSAHARHFVYMTSMVLMLACLPITFCLTDGLSNASNPIPSPQSGVVIPSSNSSPSAIADDMVVINDSLRDTNPSDAAYTAATSVSESTATANFEQPATSAALWQLASPYIVAAYILGLSIMLLRIVISTYGGHRLRRDAVLVDDENLLAVIGGLANRLGLRRVPLVAFCRRVSGPIVVGALRPMVLLPVTITTGLTPSQLEAVLTHEFAHLRHFDHWVLMLQRVIEAVLFFHPAVWYVSRCLSEEREYCCDDAVVAAGAPAVDYAELLLRLAETKMHGQPISTALAAGKKPSQLRQRIMRILSPAGDSSFRLTRGAVTLALVAFAALLILPTLSYLTSDSLAQTEAAQTEAAQTEAALAKLKTPKSPDDNSDKVEDPFVIQVIDSRGKGIGGAVIEFLGKLEPKKLENRTTVPHRPILVAHRCDEHGNVRIPPEKKVAVYAAQVRAAGFITLSERYSNVTVIISDENVNPRTITLHRPVSISGIVLGIDGKPLANAPLSISTDSARPYNAYIANHHRTISGKDGSFKFDNICPGVALLQYPWLGPVNGDVTAKRWHPWFPDGKVKLPVHNRSWTQAITVGNSKQIDNIRIDLSKSAASVTGILLNPDGSPVAGAQIAAKSIFESGDSKHTLVNWITYSGKNARATSDQEGKFRLEGLPPEQVWFIADSEERRVSKSVLLKENRDTKIVIIFQIKQADSRADNVLDNALIKRIYDVSHLVLAKNELGDLRAVNQKVPDASAVLMSLVELVRETIQPHTWSGLGGKGSIKFADDRPLLIVENTLEVHDSIKDLWQQVHNLMNLKVKCEMKVIRSSRRNNFDEIEWQNETVLLDSSKAAKYFSKFESDPQTTVSSSNGILFNGQGFYLTLKLAAAAESSLAENDSPSFICTPVVAADLNSVLLSIEGSTKEQSRSANVTKDRTLLINVANLLPAQEQPSGQLFVALTPVINDERVTTARNDDSKRADKTSGQDQVNDQRAWGEPLKGLRMRLSMLQGNEYRHGVTLPLLIEMQNVTDEPIPFEKLHRACDIKVHTEDDQWLGIAKTISAISPWERSKGSIAPNEILRWTCNFDRLRLNKAAEANSSVDVRVSVPLQIEIPGKIPTTNYSNTIKIKLIDRPYSLLPIGVNAIQLAERNVSDRWTKEMNLVYRELGGLQHSSRAIQLDGSGKLTLIDCKVKGRVEYQLQKEHLDLIAKRLHKIKVWNASQFKWQMANPDENEYQIAISYGGSSVIATYGQQYFDSQSVLVQFQQIMLDLIDGPAEIK
ncbi:MAG: beta-lactamase regulating signal transducer with metallopeptidase domain [Pirellulaceae bacterium]|jgi:beta-lactamase regulating signal transducer with metallopeptidase domain